MKAAPDIATAFTMMRSEQPAPELLRGDAQQAAADTDGGERFIAYLESRLPQIEAFLIQAAPKPAAEDASAAQAANLTEFAYEPVLSFTCEGGKRVRPALCLLGAELLGYDPAFALAPAAAIEYFQSAVLIHDDIADESELRRGVPCLHRTMGTGLAMNAGDIALLSVFEILLRDATMDDATLLQVMSEIAYMEQRTFEGQALDLGWVRQGRWDLAPDDYRAMATLKTAHYSAATPLVCGAITAHAAEEQIEALRSFGLDVGLAFQLADDLINVSGDPEVSGKDWCSDITEGKRTLIAVTACSKLAAAERDELIGILESHTAEPAQLARARELFESSGAIDEVRREAQALIENAVTKLYDVELSPKARAIATSMAHYFIARTY